MDNKQKIKCDVSNCEYNEDNCICGLKEIKVGCQCGCNAKSIQDTVCDSYKCCQDKK